MEISDDLRLFIYAHLIRNIIKAQNKVLMKIKTIYRLQCLLSIDWYSNVFGEFEGIEEEAAVAYF
jgi:hypothetical protein